MESDPFDENSKQHANGRKYLPLGFPWILGGTQRRTLIMKEVAQIDSKKKHHDFLYRITPWQVLGFDLASECRSRHKDPVRSSCQETPLAIAPQAAVLGAEGNIWYTNRSNTLCHKY